MKNCEAINYDDIKEKIELLFKELNINYKSVDFEDEDLNYLISFNTYGKLKLLNLISGILYFHHSDFTMNFLVFNIYKLSDDNNSMDTLDIYEVVNDINSELLYGSFLVEENKHILYKSSINCGNEYSGLDMYIIKRQIDAFLDGLVKLFAIIKNKEKDNE